MEGFPHGTSGKEPACQCRRHKRHRFDPWAGKMPWRREQLPTPVFWPGEFHGVYSPWGCKESNTTEQLSLHFQYSCLENSTDRGAWQATVHRVAGSDTTETTQHTCILVSLTIFCLFLSSTLSVFALYILMVCH